MRNVVLFACFLCACSPHPSHPHDTDGITETTTTGSSVSAASETEGMTGFNPTTEVNGSTGMPDTDDLPPVTTDAPTTTTGGTAECAIPVMCGDDPCLDAGGTPICGPELCAPMPCDRCPEAAFCGEVMGQAVCILNDEVPCDPPCTPLLCAQCPSNVCDIANYDLCLDGETGKIACVQDLLFCPELNIMCTEDAQCGSSAPNCINGACRAGCETTDDCGALKSLCVEGMCVDGENHPVCSVIPHEPPGEPAPACDVLGQCMNDLDCALGASLCWDFTTMKPVAGGEIGNCVAPCAGDEACGEGNVCSTLGFCVDALDAPTCGE